MRFVPLCVSCPGPVLRLFSAGGGMGGWPGSRISLLAPGSLVPSGVGPCVRGGLAPGGA